MDNDKPNLNNAEMENPNAEMPLNTPETELHPLVNPFENASNDTTATDATPALTPEVQETVNSPEPVSSNMNEFHTNEPTKGSNVIWVISGMVVALLILAVGVFMYFNSQTKKDVVSTAQKSVNTQLNTSIDATIKELNNIDSNSNIDTSSVDKDLQSL